MKTYYSHNSKRHRVFHLNLYKHEKDLTKAQVKKRLIELIRQEIGSQTVNAAWIYQRPHISVQIPGEARLYVVYQHLTEDPEIKPQN